jgi:sarcosine oxidase subunit beta
MMAEFPTTADIVIIGGGVMGASTAYHLGLKGCKHVVLLEKEPLFGAQSTGRCAGGVRYQFSTEINVRLSLLSLPMLDRFEDELGQPIDRRPIGYLFVLTADESVAHFREIVSMQRRLGVKTEWLTVDEIAAHVPPLNLDGVVAGVHHAADGLADPNSVVQGYINGARRLGVESITDTEVTGIHVQGGRIQGVSTERGDISTPVIVNAAGAWAGEVGSMAGVDIPISPVRRQIAVTGPLSEVPNEFPFVIEFERSLYFCPKGDGLLTGMSNPDQMIGFDQSVDSDWEVTHLEAAMHRLPLLEKANIASRWAGLYEVSPDAHPILGRIPYIEGLYCVGGFSGHGFMHGPIGGRLLAEEILDGAAHTLDISSLHIDRFYNGHGLVEYNVV